MLVITVKMSGSYNLDRVVIFLGALASDRYANLDLHMLLYLFWRDVLSYYYLEIYPCHSFYFC